MRFFFFWKKLILFSKDELKLIKGESKYIYNLT